MPKTGNCQCKSCQAVRENGLAIDAHKYDYLHAESFTFDYTQWMETEYRPYCTCSVCHRCNTLTVAMENRFFRRLRSIRA